jgi:hypothetical protein
VDQQLLAALIKAAETVQDAVTKLGPIPTAQDQKKPRS